MNVYILANKGAENPLYQAMGKNAQSLNSALKGLSLWYTGRHPEQLLLTEATIVSIHTCSTLRE